MVSVRAGGDSGRGGDDAGGVGGSMSKQLCELPPDLKRERERIR